MYRLKIIIHVTIILLLSVFLTNIPSTKFWNFFSPFSKFISHYSVIFKFHNLIYFWTKIKIFWLLLIFSLSVKWITEYLIFLELPSCLLQNFTKMSVKFFSFFRGIWSRNNFSMLQLEFEYCVLINQLLEFCDLNHDWNSIFCAEYKYFWDSEKLWEIKKVIKLDYWWLKKKLIAQFQSLGILLYTPTFSMIIEGSKSKGP